MPGMNEYMIAKEKARKSGAESFTYKSTKYVRGMSSNGSLVVYRRADGKTSTKPKKEKKIPKKAKSTSPKKKRALNPYMVAKETARKNDSESFMYKDTKYVRSVSSNGKLIVYRRED